MKGIRSRSISSSTLPGSIGFSVISGGTAWPLVVTKSVETRPITVGLQVFASVEQGVNWSVVSAATLLSVAPLLIAFLLFQRQFVQSFMRAGIR